MVVQPKKYRGKKNQINIVLYMQTESTDTRPSRPKKYRGEKNKINIFCFVCRRRAATEDHPDASPLPLHLFPCMLTYDVVH